MNSTNRTNLKTAAQTASLLSLLAPLSLVTILTTTPANAQTPKPEENLSSIANPGSTQSAQASQFEFDISAQPLASGLTLYGRQSGVQLAADTEFVSTLRTPGLKGRYTAEQALKRLLSGTGITFEFTRPQSVTLRTAQDGGAMSLDPIIVAGEKVERPYVDTYTSVGIATQEDIENYNVEDLNDAFNNMANVRAFPGNRGNSGFEIRGVNADGVTQPSNSAPLISVIIDGTTQSAEGLKRGSRGTWDVKQVEVLRGPQSTLQGRNALAGAVVVETNDPTWEPELLLKGVIGMLDTKEGAAAVSAPIVPDELAFRLSGQYRTQTTDITFTDEANDQHGEDKYYNIRGKLLFVPEFADGLRVLFTGSHTFDQPTGRPVSGPDFFDRILNTASTFTEFRQMTVNNFNLDASYDFGNNLTLRSISALNDTDLSIESAPSSTTFFREEHREDDDFTQDLRIEVGEDISGFSGVAGLFFGAFDQKTNSLIQSSGFTFQDGTFENGTDTIAAYIDARYRFFKRWSLIAGGRYQHDTVRNKIDITSDFGDTNSDLDTTFDVLLPKGGLAFDITDTQSIAATATRGYRQGLTEVLLGSGDQLNSVDPEFVWTYELAYRLATADNRLNFGINLFYNDYTDQQVAIINPSFSPLSNTFNAGSSTSYGAEVEGRYDFGNGFQVFGALGLLKTEFGEFEDAACAPSGGNCKGNEYPEAPAVTAAIGGAYRHPTGLFAAANANYTDSYFAKGDINNNPDLEIEGRFLANAKAGYATDHFSVALYVDNIFDKQYLTGIGSSGTEAYIGDGRTVGVEMRVKLQ